MAEQNVSKELWKDSDISLIFEMESGAWIWQLESNPTIEDFDCAFLWFKFGEEVEGSNFGLFSMSSQWIYGLN